MAKSIIIKGARVNNLKNIDLEIPRDKLVVMTGLSGSGKSSLAFDTIYAEGQIPADSLCLVRLYIEKRHCVSSAVFLHILCIGVPYSCGRGAYV